MHVHVCSFICCETCCWWQALRSCDTASNPVFVSPGHLISMETAVWLVKLCCKYRIPEPVRLVRDCLLSRDVNSTCEKILAISVTIVWQKVLPIPIPILFDCLWSPHLKLGTSCRPNWKCQPVPLTVLNALSKYFYFSLPTAVKHVLADFCNTPSVRL